MNRCRPAGMIRVGMADQHQVQMANTGLAHRGHDHPLADIELTETRPCVVEQRVIAGAQQNRQPLPHIQLQHLDLPHRHGLERRKHAQQQ